MITPYASGRMIGGAFWKITKDTNDIIYAVDFNHQQERHLQGADLVAFR